MKRKKKDIKHKLAEFTYAKPALEKCFCNLKRGLCEICDMLNDKKR